MIFIKQTSDETSRAVIKEDITLELIILLLFIKYGIVIFYNISVTFAIYDERLNILNKINAASHLLKTTNLELRVPKIIGLIYSTDVYNFHVIF